MSERLHDRLRSALARRVLPPAPATLHRRLASITATAPDRSTPVSERFARPRMMLGLAAVLAGTLAIALLGSGGDRSTMTDPPAITSVDGLPVMTVSEAIAARDAGTLPEGRVAIRGFWSGNQLRHSCPAPNDPVGDLEIYCREGEFGITERNEQLLGFERTSTGGVHVWRNDAGPYLTPWLPPDTDQPVELFPIVDEGWPAPVRIIVLGHFNDPRADECRPEAGQLCRDRLVLDRIVQFGTSVMPTPLVPPQPPPSAEASDLTEVEGWPVIAPGLGRPAATD